MSLTLGEAIDRAIKLIDEYSINGKITTTVKNADYLNKMNVFADMAQTELATYRKIPAIYEIVQTPINNLLSDQPSQAIVTHNNNDIVYSALGALSYYFEVDNVATILIKQADRLLLTIDNNVAGSFQAYKDFIPNTDPTELITMTFTGATAYNIQNVALYDTIFPNVNSIPRWAVKARYTMPSDFMSLDKITMLDEDNRYMTGMDYFWENPKTFILDHDFEGTIRINYFKYPSKITNDTSQDYEFEVAPEVANLIPYYLAWASKSSEEPQLAGQLRRIYEVMLANLEPENNQGIEVLQDVNNW